jgi:hypothetical protein
MLEKKVPGNCINNESSSKMSENLRPGRIDLHLCWCKVDGWNGMFPENL